MVFGWLKRRRRAALLKTPFPDEWRRILERNVAFYQTLDDAERRKLCDDLRVLIAETSFEGCAGLEITDEMKVTIAAQAALLLLGFPDGSFDRVTTILVYPSGFRSREGWTRPDGVVELDHVGNLGEAWRQGPVILAWDAVLAGGRNGYDGRNVVLHEFAHRLDFLDGFADGMPPLVGSDRERRWQEVMEEEYDRLVAEAQYGAPPVLDAYGATDRAEFFAVATESFFETPAAVQRRHPKLYEILRDFYRQDPAGRLEARR
jgi:Mlc titration factor MtfA (ptsG expression regulator)